MNLLEEHQTTFFSSDETNDRYFSEAILTMPTHLHAKLSSADYLQSGYLYLQYK